MCTPHPPGSRGGEGRNDLFWTSGLGGTQTISQFRGDCPIRGDPKYLGGTSTPQVSKWKKPIVLEWQFSSDLFLKISPAALIVYYYSSFYGYCKVLCQRLCQNVKKTLRYVTMLPYHLSCMLFFRGDWEIPII